MSSSLKDLQCVAVCPVVGCSRIKSIVLFTHRIGRLKNHHIYRPPADEPCMQSCAARGRPRLFHREHHWIAPVRLAAEQSSPWLRPAIYPPLSVSPDQPCSATGQGDTPKRLRKERTSSEKTTNNTLSQEDKAKGEGKVKRRALGGHQNISPVLSRTREK